MNDMILQEAQRLGAEYVGFVPVGELSEVENENCPFALIVAVPLPPEYLEMLTQPIGVQEAAREHDLFARTEARIDGIADALEVYLRARGYRAFSQSERANSARGRYDGAQRKATLQHKTVARLAGLGWIGKSDLLVSPQWGSGLCMCTLLTDAPLQTQPATPLENQCGACTVCRDVCPAGALQGRTWTKEGGREELFDPALCCTCLRCMSQCPWTRAYVRRANLSQGEGNR